MKVALVVLTCWTNRGRVARRPEAARAEALVAPGANDLVAIRIQPLRRWRPGAEIGRDIQRRADGMSRVVSWRDERGGKHYVGHFRTRPRAAVRVHIRGEEAAAYSRENTPGL